MALTISVKSSFVAGNKRLVAATVQFDSSYPTNGEAVTAADFGLSGIDYLIPEYPATWDQTNKKIKMNSPVPSHAHDMVTANSAAGTALTGAANALNANVASFTITGGGASGIQNKIIELPTEVANTTNLSTVTISVLVFGH